MDDGTIVTVNANFQQQAQVTRWRLPESAERVR
jgi:hypothetical protein